MSMFSMRLPNYVDKIYSWGVDLAEATKGVELTDAKTNPSFSVILPVEYFIHNWWYRESPDGAGNTIGEIGIYMPNVLGELCYTRFNTAQDILKDVVIFQYLKTGTTSFTEVNQKSMTADLKAFKEYINANWNKLILKQP